MRKRTTASDLWPEEPLFASKEEHGLQKITADTAFDDERKHEDIGVSVTRDDQVPQNKKNLNPTCVTPLVESLARPYYSELVVAGERLDQSIDGVVEKRLLKNQVYKDLFDKLLDTLHSAPAHIVFKDENLRYGRSRKNLWKIYNSVLLDQKEFSRGDTIVVPAGSTEKGPAPTFPRHVDVDAKFHPCLGEYFWFAQILSIRSDDNTAHVRWFQHGCQTILQELAHPQELFLTSLCDDIPLVSILAKWPCRRVCPGERPSSLKHDDLFYSLEYDASTALFKDIATSGESSDNSLCTLCRAREKEQDRAICQRLIDGGKFSGLTLRGEQIHCADSVFFYFSKDEPCGIGQVISITEKLSTSNDDVFDLHIRLYGKHVDVLRNDPRLTASINDDRQLFLTDEEIQIASAQVIGKCLVIHGKTTRNLEAWLSYSPSHFFVLSHAPRRRNASQETIIPLAARNFHFCRRCMDTVDQYMELFRECKGETTPLRVFDPFVGVGAFPLAMELASNIKLTHAIEISSSAAQTLKQNNPSTIVYNQCSNKVLDYAVKRARGFRVSLKSLDGEDEDLPPPPNKDDIDCIVSGFPCRPHSKLNMFPKVRDLENELFLNTISWVEFLRPKYCLFENVEGFTSFNLKATQKNKHKVQGGIEKGGIKLLIRILITLGYQVRFGLLQAGHYGTPQTRIRFFLWAARTGLPLPDFPRPTHHFPRSPNLKVRFPNGDSTVNVALEKGVAPLPFATIRDAISDLKRWDWAEPGRKRKHSGAEDEHERQDILQIQGHKDDSWCGFSGKDIGYEHPPRSPFSARCRRIPTDDIQHITAIHKDDMIQRVRGISLDPGADYRRLGLKPSLWDFNMDPRSANARNGYRGGYYGRLDPDTYFNTTVTNVYPTATQSWVLNPWCKRMLSVRELARSQGFPDSFVFTAPGDSVRTMHKHIGNAVPWPMGEALGRELQLALFEEWKKNRELNAMDID